VIPKVRLNNGLEIPQIGLGTWQMHGSECYQAVRWALEAGYRHFDTAYIYRNESEVGRAIKDSGIDRSDIWVTTKIFPPQFINPASAIAGSLERLGLDYLDLYLIHWPPPIGTGERVYKKLEELLAQKLTRSIGISNYGAERLAGLLPSVNIQPAVNQIEITPWNYPLETIAFCQDRHVAVEAYSPLAMGQRLDDPGLLRLAQRLGKSPAQLLIAWNLHRGLISLPKAAQKAHILENIQVFDFELSQAEIAELERL
jgi:diketogulonate reductase-like aldo/keto reductase